MRALYINIYDLVGLFIGTHQKNIITIQTGQMDNFWGSLDPSKMDDK